MKFIFKLLILLTLTSCVSNVQEDVVLEQTYVQDLFGFKPYDFNITFSNIRTVNESGDSLNTVDNSVSGWYIKYETYGDTIYMDVFPPKNVANDAYRQWVAVYEKFENNKWCENSISYYFVLKSGSYIVYHIKNQRILCIEVINDDNRVEFIGN